ncbi:hypothetical protein STEG23_009921, partial [Scotinomys teguina]
MSCFETKTELTEKANDVMSCFETKTELTEKANDVMSCFETKTELTEKANDVMSCFETKTELTEKANDVMSCFETKTELTEKANDVMSCFETKTELTEKANDVMSCFETKTDTGVEVTKSCVFKSLAIAVFLYLVLLVTEDQNRVYHLVSVHCLLFSGFSTVVEGFWVLSWSQVELCSSRFVLLLVKLCARVLPLKILLANHSGVVYRKRHAILSASRNDMFLRFHRT